MVQWKLIFNNRRNSEMNILYPLIKGFLASGCLIVAIGAQNAFVLKQGLRQHHTLLTALVCSFIDAGLIVAGVLGLGKIISSYPAFIELTKYFASIFLFIYGTIAFRSAFKIKKTIQTSTNEITLPAIKQTILLLLALSLLNPHVYLDTVILLGSIASEHPAEEKLYFCLGAIAASFSWFFTISYGARLLNPLFKKESSWKFIDGFTGLTMWGMAFTLLI